MQKAKLELSDILQAIEFMDSKSMKVVNQQFKYKNPFGADYPFYAIIEVAGNAEGSANAERLLNLFAFSNDHIIVTIVLRIKMFLGWDCGVRRDAE